MSGQRGKWVFYTVYKIDPDGVQRLIEDADRKYFIDDRNYRFLWAHLPGNLREGERVSIFMVRGQPYQRCVVGEREYQSINDRRGYRIRWESVQ